MTAHQRVDSAVAAAAEGWPVFPLLPGSKRPRAQLTAWETKATLDAERITRWWSRHPDDNVAIATGPADLVVVDLDRARPGETAPPEWQDATGGADVLTTLADRLSEIVPATRTVATPSGGRHLYYRSPAGTELRSTAGRVGWKIDTRSLGGYVVAPGSELAAGRYLIVDDRPPVALPSWLALALRPPSPAPSSHPESGPPQVDRTDEYGAAALHGEVDRVLAAPPGTRNAALNLAAWNLGRLVATGVLDRVQVEEVLCQAGRTAGGQTPAAVSATVRSALSARLRRAAHRGCERQRAAVEGAKS